jgi:hypothetical protein
MTSHLDRPTGDSAMGVIGMAGLLIIGLVILLVRAPGPAPLPVDAPPATLTPVAVSGTTTTLPRERWVTRSTNYCYGTTTASGTPARVGVVAVSYSRFPHLRGSTWRILTGPLAGRVVTVEDKGPKAEFDVYVTSCPAAIQYGRRTIVVERVG